ncbi:galactose-3-O-sulfotransferase 3 [Aplysia californica]|uniref:Galactose-3-O-sulfotransferase 3 n=1 Tax=Aplysia californica TaxID=6500 RepID=A0ABM0JCB5_APLCA|nr:galactose-3-O-sulfotransferase 3 [Aplysia californica]
MSEATVSVTASPTMSERMRTGLFSGNKSSEPNVPSTLNKNREKEIQHVVFVKVHKAASTTMHNILMRYAIKHELNVLLPKAGLHINQNGHQIPDDNLSPIPAGSKYDILSNHLIFDHDEVSSFFPADTFYVGIIREPFSQFLSAFVYYSQIWRHQNLLNVIKDYPDNPIEAFIQYSGRYIGDTKPNTVYVNNRMSVDFGFPLENFEASKRNHTKIESFLQQIDAIFDVVLIAEMFDESLVLLRRMLGWTTKDIIYMDKNVFSGQHAKPSWIQKRDYSAHIKHLFENYAAIDIALYDYFLNRFEQKLDQQPKDFYAEVEAFKKLKLKITSYCTIMDNRTHPFESLHFPASEQLNEFTLTPSDCVLMKLEERQITMKTRQVQEERFLKMGKPRQKFWNRPMQPR